MNEVTMVLFCLECGKELVKITLSFLTIPLLNACIRYVKCYFAMYFCFLRYTKKEKRRYKMMEILVLLFGLLLGGLPTLYLIYEAIATISMKIYRKVKHGTSLFD